MTTTASIDATAPDSAPAPLVMFGYAYDGTAELSLPEVADLIRNDIRAVQDDEMIHADAVFVVTVDESGPQNQIRITVSGLHHGDADTVDASTIKVTRKTFRSAFALASHYNRFETCPYQLRFLVVIQAVSGDGTVYAEGVGAIGHWDLPKPSQR